MRFSSSLSISARAFLRSKVTQAKRPSGDIAIDSGSRSCATLAFGPVIRTPARISSSRRSLRLSK